MVNGGFYDGLWWILWWLMVDFMMVNNSLLSMLSWDDIHQAMLMMVYDSCCNVEFMMVNGGFYDG